MHFGISYFGVRDPRHAAADLDEIAAAGFRAVTHTLSEYDLRYHLEDVRRLVVETKRRGLETALDPWGVAGLFGGEAYSELALTDLGSRQLDAAGASVPACCPLAPATRDLLGRWTRTATTLGADVLFWDEPHFYVGALRGPDSPPCCRCENCRAEWARLHTGEPLPPEGDARLAEFRTGVLRDLLAELIDESATAVRHSLCLLPHGDFPAAGTDSWALFARSLDVSRLATDPYWLDRTVSAGEHVRRHAVRLRELCDATEKEMEIWIQGIRIPAGQEGRILEGVEAAVKAGADRIAFWSFRGTERMSALACERPRVAWECMVEAVRRFGVR
jgi:hypothetical protein